MVTNISKNTIDLIQSNRDYYFNIFVREGALGLSRILGVNVNTLRTHVLPLVNFTRKDIDDFRELSSTLFDTPSMESCYILGYVLGDGCIQQSHSSYRPSLDITSKDESIILSISKSLGDSFVSLVKPITYHANRYRPECSAFNLSFTSRSICNRLMELGISFNKSNLGCSMDWSFIKPFLFDFVRGLLDSNGSVHLHSGTPSISGHPSYLLELQSLLLLEGIDCSVSHRTPSFCILSFREFSSSLLYKNMYCTHDIGSLFLERKKVLFKASCNFSSFSGSLDSNISSVEFLEDSVNMIDIEVEGVSSPNNHSYYLEGMHTHNCSQELRVCANIANEQTWIDTFNSGDDLHKIVAIQMWGEENYNRDKRKIAKAISFGILYGMSPRSFAEKNHVSLSEAEDFFNRYYRGAPNLTAWMDYTKRKAMTTGFNYTFFGRPRRFLHYLTTGNGGDVGFAKRVAVNSIIQGTSADIGRLGLIRTYKLLLTNPKFKDKVFFASMIHDEISLIVHESVLHEVDTIFQQCLNVHVSQWKCQLDTDLEIGRAWGASFNFTRTDTTFKVDINPLPDNFEALLESTKDLSMPVDSFHTSDLLDEDNSDELGGDTSLF